MSAVPHTSSAVSSIVAPAATYSSSGICEPSPGGLLHHDLVAVLDELVHADRGQGHAVLAVLDFLGYADLHALLLRCSRGPRTVWPASQRGRDYSRAVLRASRAPRRLSTSYASTACASGPWRTRPRGRPRAGRPWAPRSAPSRPPRARISKSPAVAWRQPARQEDLVHLLGDPGAGEGARAAAASPRPRARPPRAARASPSRRPARRRRPAGRRAARRTRAALVWRYCRRHSTRSSSSTARTTTAPGCSRLIRLNSLGVPRPGDPSSRSATTQSSRCRSLARHHRPRHRPVGELVGGRSSGCSRRSCPDASPEHACGWTG